MKLLIWLLKSPFRLIAWFWRRTRKSYTGRKDHVVDNEESMRRLLWEIHSGKDDDNGDEN